MKYVLFVLSIIVIAVPSSAGTDDLTASFVEQCTTISKQTPSYCECSLVAFSKTLRDARKRELQSLEVYEDGYRKGLLSDPAMTESKVDSVCDLHDEALEYDRQSHLLSRQTEKQAIHDLRVKKLELLEQKRNLVESYGANNQTAASLISGNYCDDRKKLREIRQDQAEDDEVIYGEVRRLLEASPNFYASAIFSTGRKSNCS